MTDYEIDEPDNLWEAIESQRAETSSTSRPMKRPVMIWVKRSIAAAAMIAVVISAGVHLINIKQEASLAPLRTKATDNPASSLENSTQNIIAHTVRDKQPSKTLIAQNTLPAHDSDMLPPLPSVQTEVQVETADNHPDENRDNPSVVEDKPVKTNDTSEKVERIGKQQFPSKTDNGYIASIPKKMSTSNNVSVSIYSSGGTGSALYYNSKVIHL